MLVTTPQQVSLGAVRREITFCKTADLRILGVFENMSGFACPHCSACVNVFSSGGGEALAGVAGVPFLGVVPIDPRVGEALDGGTMPDMQSQSMQSLCKFAADLIAKE